MVINGLWLDSKNDHASAAGSTLEKEPQTGKKQFMDWLYESYPQHPTTTIGLSVPMKPAHWC